MSSDHPLQPTTPQLLKATAAAAVAASVILLVAVFPAEYGRDPTGLGKLLGLMALSATPEEAALLPTGAAPEAAAAVIASPTPFQTGEMSLTLLANEGAEIKAQMQSGDTFVFSWSTDGGPVNFDMHGEKPNDGDNFTSYWKDRGQTSANGSFTAPFDGAHGWYWKNKGSTPVTVTVKISGYFAKLYRPG
ncbi:MAG: hypothetical protein EPN60_16250 [Nevskiaceae bacterium]|nr:MAG: hypothetical protein EPN60_16250 [Nevskiaceae bacterium]